MIMKKSLNKKKAFTLVEMIAAVSMFMIISLAVLSMITYVFKINAINRKTYDANIYAKATLESLKAYKPKVGVNIKEGSYIFTFNDMSDMDLSNYYKIFMDSSVENGVPNIEATTVQGYEIARQKAINNNKNVAMEVFVKWQGKAVGDITIKETHLAEIEVWVWDISKGEISEVNRKTIISPEK